MTTLDKTVARRTRRPHPKHDRAVVVSLVPGDVVSVRLERSTRSYSLPVDRLYDLAEFETMKGLGLIPPSKR